MWGDAKVPQQVMCDLLRQYANLTNEERKLTNYRQLTHDYDAKGRWWNVEKTGRGASTLCSKTSDHTHFGSKPLENVSMLWNSTHGRLSSTRSSSGEFDPFFHPEDYILIVAEVERKKDQTHTPHE